MPSLTPREVLARSTLFQGVPEEALEKVLSLAISRSYTKNQTIFLQGDPGDALHGIAAGRVLISASGIDGKDVSLNIMKPGDVFGEIALLDGQPRTANATTMEDSEVITVHRDHFRALLQSEPSLAIHLLELVCRRVRWTTELVEESALLSVSARLAKRLLSLIELSGEASSEGQVLRISQNDLAQFLGITRQIVNQYLQNWRKKGWVELGRSKIIVLDEDALGDVSLGEAD